MASASVYSMGAARSSTSPENFGRTAAEILCGDLARSSNISLQNCGREGLGFGDIVETIVQTVRRQKRRNIHVEIQQVMDRARIFGLAEPLERAPAGIGMRGSSLVDRCFQ